VGTGRGGMQEASTATIFFKLEAIPDRVAYADTA
jgi:hypothetical protein